LQGVHLPNQSIIISVRSGQQRSTLRVLPLADAFLQEAVMKTRLYNLWESIQSSLWFVPGLMSFSAICFAFFLLFIDDSFTLPSSSIGKYLYNAGPEGARSLLSTIAGSVITVAGVTFSITVVALTLASSQFGPRLLRNFMKDKANQMVIGTFVSTFIYCLLVLRSVEMYHQASFVPSLSVTMAVVLMVVNAAVLVFFIHHISSSIQADSVITNVYRELVADIERLFTDDENSSQKRSFNHAEVDGYAHELRLKNKKDGYIQALNTKKLMEIAFSNDLLLQIPFRAGQYAMDNDTLVMVRSREKIGKEIVDPIDECFLIGSVRTPEQDPEYAIHQLVEVALRALSPSINDPFTAATCIDRLGSAISLLTTKSFPPKYEFDADNTLRLITNPSNFKGMVDTAFNQIRQYGATSVAVTIRLLEVIEGIAVHATGKEHRDALHRQARMIKRVSRETIPEKYDREDVDKRYERVLKALNITEYAPVDKEG